MRRNHVRVSDLQCETKAELPGVPSTISPTLVRAHGENRALVPVDTSMPRSWDGRVAYVVSQVGSPPVLTTGAVALLAAALSGLRAWLWAGAYVGFSMMTPLVYLVWLLWRGRITDLDVQLREQRMRPMLFTIACAIGAWLLLLIGAAPQPLVILAGALLIETLILFVITLRWKISVHCAAAAGAATVIWSIVGSPLPLLVGVPLIAWSRVRLHRHTLAQVVAGSILGVAVFVGTFLIS